MTYNADGQIKTTQVDGSVYTGLYAADGSWNIVVNDGSTYKGRYHPCGAFNAVLTADSSAGALAPNGSMYVVDTGNGYVPATVLGPSGINRFPLQKATLTRIKAAVTAATGNNPVDLADMASPPTQTNSATHDATLTAQYTPNGNRTLFRVSTGPLFYRASTGAVYVSSHDVTPGAGALQLTTGLSPTPANGDDEITYQIDFVVNNAQVVELDMKTGTVNQPFRVIVNGQFVSRDGVTNTSRYYKMDFGSTQATINITVEVGQGLALQGVNISAGGTITAPTSTVYRMAALGDSITESQVYGDTVFYPYDGIPYTAAKQLGFNSVRNTAVGGTGYWNAGGGPQGSGTRQDAVNQLPYWVNRDQYDLIFAAHGYNDYNNTTQANMVNKAQACWSAVRAAQPQALIVVMGIWPERTGPSAPILAGETALKNQFTAWNDPCSLFIPVGTDPGGSWLTGTGFVGNTNGTGNSDIYVSSDGTHPSRAGRVYLGGKVNTAIRAALPALYTKYSVP